MYLSIRDEPRLARPHRAHVPCRRFHSGRLKRTDECIAVNPRLGADRTKGGTLQQPVIRDSRRCSCAVRIHSDERDVFAFPHRFEPQEGQRSKHPVLGRVDRELAQCDDSGQLRFSEEGLKHGGLGLEGLGTECLDMESDRGLHIEQSVLVGVPLPDNDALHAERIGDVAISVLLDDDLDRAHVTAIIAQRSPARGTGPPSSASTSELQGDAPDEIVEVPRRAFLAGLLGMTALAFDGAVSPHARRDAEVSPPCG